MRPASSFPIFLLFGFLASASKADANEADVVSAEVTCDAGSRCTVRVAVRHAAVLADRHRRDVAFDQQAGVRPSGATARA